MFIKWHLYLVADEDAAAVKTRLQNVKEKIAAIKTSQKLPQEVQIEYISFRSKKEVTETEKR